MNSRTPQSAVMVLCGFLSFGAAGAERSAIIDRIAVVAGSQVITATQIEREIRITAFMNGSRPDLSPPSKRASAERLIDQDLVRQDMEISRYQAPASGEEQEQLKQVKAQAGSEERFRGKLREYGITEQDLRQHMLWQLTFLRFIDMRFRPGTQVQDDDVRAYFKKEILPKLPSQADQDAEYENYRDRIEKKLEGALVDQALDAWLKETRDHTRIEFRKEAFE